ncbi:MAG TPA: lysyl oxidase family protein, partial [Thermoleophilaceae bacterium]
MSRRILARACAVAACLTLVQAASAYAAPVPLLPDLVADTPRWPRLEQYSDSDGTRLLIRFDGFIHNAGAGPADMRGYGRAGTQMSSVVQRVHRSDGTWFEEARPGATIRYEAEDGHNHWHLAEAARYSLWNWEDTAEVAPAMKVGFCFEDSEHVDAHGPVDGEYLDDNVRFCAQHEPEVASVFMGISAGWRDIYDSGLAFQWVDVSDVAPGRYWLHAEVDPHDVVRESDEQNVHGVSDMAPTVPGYAARAIAAEGLTAGAPAGLTLRAVIWGDPGQQQFRIESAPAHGKLNVPAGEWFTGPGVSYTPDAGYEGSDSFTFSSRDATSPFPRHPVVATAALGVERAAEAVAISGAPAQLTAGTSAQLSSLVTGGPPQVTWTATAGTISPSGLYTAPATPPAGGSATIRATASTGAFAEVAVRIAAAAAPAPAPSPGGDPGPAPVLTPLLAKPRISVRGRVVTTST